MQRHYHIYIIARPNEFAQWKVIDRSQGRNFLMAEGRTRNEEWAREEASDEIARRFGHASSTIEVITD